MKMNENMNFLMKKKKKSLIRVNELKVDNEHEIIKERKKRFKYILTKEEISLLYNNGETLE